MHYEHHRYVGKVCVVTGAANGLGLNLAKRLLEEGALLAALDLEEDSLKREYEGQEDRVLCISCCEQRVDETCETTAR